MSNEIKEYRKLSAIMFTDMVGYTSLTGKDEALSIELLEEHRKLIREILPKHNGKEIKTIGDAFHLEFNSALEAIRCAIEIQKTLNERNKSTSEDRKIQIRIGIHVGDVVYKEGDMYGDGVNIASRLESLAQAGGICISERVYDDIRNKTGIEAIFLGEKILKNVTHSVKVYAIAGEGMPVPSIKTFDTKQVKVKKLNLKALLISLIITLAIIGYFIWNFSKDKEVVQQKSIAVIPFENLTGDTNYDIWQKGIAELFITSLSGSSELHIVDSQTLFDVLESMGQPKMAQIAPSIVKQMATKVNVETVVLGSILKAGNKLRIQVKLQHAQSGKILKTEVVECEKEDDFFYVTKTLSDRVKNYLEIKVLKKHVDYDVREALTTSAEAYRYYIEGTNLFNSTDFSSAINSFSKAVEIDTNFTFAYLYLTIANLNIGQLEEAKQWLKEADKRKDKISNKFRFTLEAFRAFLNKNMQEHIQWLKKVLEIDPQLRTWWYQLGFAYTIIEQYDKAIEPLEKAMELSFKWGSGWKFAYIYTVLGKSYHEIGKHKQEIEIYEKGLKILPDHQEILGRMAIEFLSRGDTTQVKTYLSKFQLKVKEEGWTQPHILLILGLIYYEAGILDKAEKYYRNAIEADAKNDEALNNLAYLLIDNDINVEEGIKLIQLALKISPDNPYYLHTQGWGYYKQGKYEKAVEVLKIAWEKYPYYDHVLYQHLEKVNIVLSQKR